MKGHKALCPCRMCRIGIRIWDSRNKRSTCLCPAAIIPREPMSSSIVQRSHCCARTISLLCRPSSGVRAHRNTARGASQGVWYQRNHFSQRSRVPEVSSVVLYEFMHLVRENLTPNLVLFWSVHCKEMDEAQPYILHVFGRLLVLHLRQLQERYLHYLGVLCCCQRRQHPTFKVCGRAHRSACGGGCPPSFCNSLVGEGLEGNGGDGSSDDGGV